MRLTRKAHRNTLRAARLEDKDWMRAELHALYDPSASPLVHLTRGPEKTCLVPLVDGALLTAYTGSAMHHELCDNLQKLSANFGVSSTDLQHVMKAVGHARHARDPGAYEQMQTHLERAGYGVGSGLCVPDGIVRQM